jgi:UDPglucose 6-dehydrogenase
MKKRSGPRVGIAGLGYMGLATGLGFAHRGVDVVGYEVRADVRRSLARGRTSIHEPGIGDLLRRGVASHRFRLVDSWAALLQESDTIFLCLPTPRRPDGRIDLRPMLRGIRELGAALRASARPKLVVVKSTVVPGTTEGILRPALERASGRRSPSVRVATNPEFLAEGSMVHDVLEPERIVFGVSSPADARQLRAVYRGFPAPVIVLSPTGAELVKYASNAFLALKVTFVNEIARVAEAVGADVDAVADAVGRDSRIGGKFLSAGPGFGGSCFEKDVRALVARSHDLGVRPRTLEALVPSNEDQTRHAFDLIRSAVGPLRGKRVAILGLSFKAGTDDVRESRALPLAREIRRQGANVRLHDPVSLENFRRAWGGDGGREPRGVRFCRTVAEALQGADVAVVQASWPEYLNFPLTWTARMRRPLVVDLRRALPMRVRARSDLRWVGLGTASAGPGESVAHPGPVRARPSSRSRASRRRSSK